jgi:integrase
VRRIERLTAIAVTKASTPGMYADGGGLYLQLALGGTKSWIFRFVLNGRERQMGLGPFHDVSLADARGKAAACRSLTRTGLDPVEARKGERRLAQLEAARAITFEKAAEAYINSHVAAWRNKKHASQWRNTLKTYVYPHFGSLPVQSIDTTLVMNAVEPIWTKKTETASRVRGRIEAILDWASTRGYRTGENPARWRGHLENLLPSRTKVTDIKHHAALPFAEIPSFTRQLRAQSGTAARALEFLILTASRTSEVIGARWDEINITEKVWIVPVERMKAHKSHRVPLTPAALAIITEMQKARSSVFIFPGLKKDKALSNMAMLALLKRMGHSTLTAHGFRSTFRDWVAEKTTHPAELAELALAHTIANKVEAAYRRGDQFEKRRKLMDEWAQYCG